MLAMYIDCEHKAREVDILDGMLSVSNILDTEVCKIISDAFGYNVIFIADGKDRGYEKNKTIICDTEEIDVYGPIVVAGANYCNRIVGLSGEQYNWLKKKFTDDTVDIRTRRKYAEG